MVFLGAAAAATLLPAIILIALVMGVPLVGLTIFLFQHPILSIGIVAGILGTIYIFR